MTSTAVSRAFASNASITGLADVKARMADIEGQKSRGLTKYPDISRMIDEGVYETYTSSVSQLNQIDATSVTNSLVKSKLGVQQGIATQLQAMAIDFRSKVMEYDGSTAQINIADMATQALRQIALTLNAHDGNSYLFAGSSANIAPIEDVDKFVKAAMSKDGNINANYTKVVKEDRFIRIDFSREINIGIDAANPAFQQLIAAFKMVKDLQAGDLANKEKVINTFDKAFDLFEELKVSIGTNQNILDEADKSLLERRQLLTETTENLFKSNLADLLVEGKEAEKDLNSIYHEISLKGKQSLLDWVSR